MSLAQLSRLVLRSPAQVAASLPALIGFTPVESLVVIMLEDDTIEVTMRVDLPDEWDEAASHVTSTATRIGVDSVVVVVCSDNPGGWTESMCGVKTLMAELERSGVQVQDALYVQDNLYWSYVHGTPDSKGAVFFPQDSPLPLTAVETRKSVTAHYDLRPGEIPSDAVYATAATHLDGCQLERAEQALKALAQLGTRPVSQDKALLLATVQLAAQDLGVRDWLLSNAVQPGCEQFIEALAQVALTATDALRPRVSGLAAAALLATNPSTVPASCLLEHAGEDSLGELVRRSIAYGLHPKEIRETFISALPQTTTQLETKEQVDDGNQEQSIGSSHKRVQSVS
jgi:hypothetical protein